MVYARIYKTARLPFFMQAQAFLISKGKRDSDLAGIYHFKNVLTGLRDCCNLQSNFLGLHSLALIDFCSFVSRCLFLDQGYFLTLWAQVVVGSSVFHYFVSI